MALRALDKRLIGPWLLSIRRRVEDATLEHEARHIQVDWKEREEHGRLFRTFMEQVACTRPRCSRRCLRHDPDYEA
jgi:hypothetical protein